VRRRFAPREGVPLIVIQRQLGHTNLGELSPKAIFWLDGPTKVFIVDKSIYKWPRQKIGEIEGRIVIKDAWAISDYLAATYGGAAPHP
jgi:hypothetical protein